MRSGWLCLLLLGCEPFHAQPLVCEGELVDADKDARHCGACGEACVGVRGVADGRCVAGRCLVTTCESERFELDHLAANGCEVERRVCGEQMVDVQTDPENCGGCGRRCGRAPFRPAYASEVACVHGVCVATACRGEVVESFEESFEGHPVPVVVCGPEPPDPSDPKRCRGSDETCDAFDDDCDDRIDEDVASVVCGEGACRREVPGCVDGVPQQCAPGTPIEEVCNGSDDDCDGETDEEITSLRCGHGPCAKEAPGCVDGRPGQCEPDLLAAVLETCNGMDDDCDGEIDDVDGLGAACTAGQGACAVEGVQVCGDTEDLVCDASPGPGSEEVCNGVDDD